MYIDKENLFTATAADLSAVASAGEVFGDSVINMSSAVDIGRGRPIYAVFVIDAALTSANSTATMVFAVVDELNTTIDTDSVQIVQTDPLLVTRLTVGKVIVLPIPSNLITQQYLGVSFTGGVETTTAGSCTAFLALEAQTN